MMRTPQQSGRAAAAKLWPVIFAATLAMSSLAGCASGMDWTTIKSKADLEGAAPITRLLVLADMRSEGFGSGMYDGFEAGMTSMLTTCGVTPRMMHTEASEPVAREAFDKAMQEFHPGAVLLIKATHVSIVRKQREMLDDNNLLFELQILDVETDKPIWKAEAQLQLTRNVRYDDKRTGSDFATHIIWRLRGDGLLNGCPVGKLPLPKGRRIPT